MKINGVEIPDIDSCDLAVMETYEAAHNVVAKKAEEMNVHCKTRTEVIRYQCEAIFEFFDTVFGPGTAKLVFGDTVNMRTCFEAYEQVINIVNKQDVEFGNEYTRKFSPKKNGGKIYPNPNHHNHKKKKRR